eukprot:5030543-Pyramimonas_sp.AAC.1
MGIYPAAGPVDFGMPCGWKETHFSVDVKRTFRYKRSSDIGGVGLMWVDARCKLQAMVEAGVAAMDVG